MEKNIKREMFYIYIYIYRERERERERETEREREASQVALVVKNPPASAGYIRNMDLIPGSGISPGQPTSVFLPGESHGQRSLVGYSP